jgi:uroporphyrinogen-III synthase
VPARFVAESLIEAFPPPSPDDHGRVLLARAAVARDVLPDGLTRAGWEVDVVDAYQTVAASVSEAQREAVAGADTVLFTSSSTVTRFVEAFGVDAVPPTVACIGPITAATAGELGLRVDVVAGEHTVEGLLAELVRFVQASPPSSPA